MARARTRMSGVTTQKRRWHGWFTGLARLSLLLLAPTISSGCLIDDPPPYVAPKQTRALLDWANASPFMEQIIIANDGDAIPFLMPFESEDADEDLYALLLFDFSEGQKGPDQLAATRIAASTLEDKNARLIRLTWVVRNGTKPGCHRITLRVTHFDNLASSMANGEERGGVDVIDRQDLAEAYWFANVNVPASMANQLVDCPSASRGQP
jgi:hypothetical protein